MQVLLEAARTQHDQRTVRAVFDSTSLRHKLSPTYLILMAIDLSTGDSVLHAAAAAGNGDALAAAVKMFRGRHGLVEHEHTWHLIRTRRNAAGDTVLHVAARTGRQDIVTGAYRQYFSDGMPNEQDIREPGVELPAEEWTYVDGERESHAHMPPLVYLLMQNNSGPTAAEEARATGHEGIAKWLDAVLERLDPDHESADRTGMQRMQDMVRGRYIYDE